MRDIKNRPHATRARPRGVLLGALLAAAFLAFAAQAASAALSAPQNLGTAVNVVLGTPVGASLVKGETDYYKVTLLRAANLSITTASALDMEGVLFDASGKVLAEDSDSAADGLNFLIRKFLPAGTYYFAVFDYSDGAGAYTVRAENGPGPVAVGVGRINGSASGPGDARLYSVTMPQAGMLSLNSTGTIGLAAEVRDLNGQLMAADANSATGSSFRIQTVLPKGAYYAEIRQNRLAPASFAFDVGLDATGDALASDGQIITSMTEPAESRLVSVRLDAPGRIFLTSSASDPADPTAILYSALGQQIMANDDAGAATLEFSVDTLGNVAPGTYFLKVGEAEGAMGSVTVSAFTTSAGLAEVAIPATNNGTATNSTTVNLAGGETSWIKLSYLGFGRLILTANGVPVSGTLYDSNGNILATFTGSIDLQRFFVGGGPLYLAVTPTGGGGQITVDVSMARFLQPGLYPLIIGD